MIKLGECNFFDRLLLLFNYFMSNDSMCDLITCTISLIIGKGGATVKMIQDRTNSNVQIPPNADEDNPAVRTLSIGAETREAVEACQMEIFNTLQQQQQQLMSGTPSVSSYQPQVFTMAVPDDRVGIVIGKGGSTIKDLQSRYGVRIQIPGYADVGSMPPIRTVR